jgi:hypothetical protein
MTLFCTEIFAHNILSLLLSLQLRFILKMEFMSEALPTPDVTRNNLGRALREKLLRQESLSASEIGMVQREALRKVADLFLNNKGVKGAEIAFRNPAVFFENISLAELPEEVQQKLTFISETAYALMGLAYGGERDQHVMGSRPADRLHGLQSLVLTNEFSRFDQRYIGLLAQELADVFTAAWENAINNNSHQTTAPDRVNYYAGNAIASATRYLDLET